MVHRIRILSTMLALVIALVGCAAPAAQPAPAESTTLPPEGASAVAASPVAAEPKPVVGGTVNIGNTADPVFNWFQQSTLPTLYLHKVFFNALTRFSDTTLEPVPDLAMSWESSEDAMTWTFHLRNDVKWHDGTPFTAEDVKFTYDFVTGPNTLRKEVRLAPLKETKVLDAYTVQFVLSQPVAPAPLNLSFNVPIMPKHRLDGVDMKNDTSFNLAPVGTGPYRFVEQVKGSHVALEANPDYFRGKPKIDRLIFKVLADVNTQIALLKTGELDVAVIEPTHISALEGDSTINVVAHDGTTYFYFSMNTRKELFKDQRVRLALTEAIDRQTIIETVLSGYASIGIGPVPPALERHFNSDLEPRPYDPEHAKQLLAEAGWSDTNGDGIVEKDGQPLKFSLLVDRGNPTRERISALAQQYWKAIGADVAIDAKEWSSFVAQYQNQWDESTGVRNWDVVFCWIGLAPDPDGTREYHTMPGVLQGARWGYSNAKVDELLEAGLAATDLDERANIYKEYQAVLYEDAPLVYLYYPQELLALRTRVQGVPTVGGLRIVLSYVDQWYLTQ